MNKAPHISPGFYYHYKHDLSGEINTYSYEVLGISFHTEDRTYAVTYRPLYKNTFLQGADFCVRPYEMFIEDVEVDGRKVPRFSKISDPVTISHLERIKTEMYAKIA